MLLCSVGLIFMLSSFFYFYFGKFINTDDRIFIEFDQMLSSEKKYTEKLLLKNFIFI